MSFQGKSSSGLPYDRLWSRKLRVRHIYYINCLEIEGSLVLFRIGCEAGTYVRKYCYDIGEALLCGADIADFAARK